MGMEGINVVDPLGVFTGTDYEEIFDPLGLSKQQQKKIEKQQAVDEPEATDQADAIREPPPQTIPAAKIEGKRSLQKPTGGKPKVGAAI